MGTHVVVGAGGIGRATARHLLDKGEQVVLASRSGRDPHLPGVRAVAVDAADEAALTALLRGASTLVNATNPPHYYTWERDWPPVARAILGACESTGAGLVTVSNLYGYGPVDGPLTEDTPLAARGPKGAIRAQMWTDALDAHRAGRVRATEVRPSDYFGPDGGPGLSQLNGFVVEPVVKGRTAWIVGPADVQHSWSYLEDIGALAATLATDDRGWGRPWHVPSPPPRTMREVAADVAELVGRRRATIRRLPAVVRAVARASRTVRELDETAHQFTRPWLLDASAAERTFGLAPTAWDVALERTVDAVRRAVR